MTIKPNNDKELVITLGWALKFAQSMEENTNSECPEEVHPFIWQAQYDGLKFQCMELSEVAIEYIKEIDSDKVSNDYPCNECKDTLDADNHWSCYKCGANMLDIIEAREG